MLGQIDYNKKFKFFAFACCLYANDYFVEVYLLSSLTNDYNAIYRSVTV